jgi:hypothetical protein
MSGAEHPADNVNTRVRDYVALLEEAVADQELIVDQILLDRLEALCQSFAKLRRQGPQRLRQARSAKTRRRPKRDAS